MIIKNVSPEMEKTLEKANRILEAKIKTYTNARDKLQSDAYFKKYIDSKIKKTTETKLAKEKSQAEEPDVVVD